MFTSNVGTPDRIIRFLLGAIIALLPLIVPALGTNLWLAIGLPIIGAVLIATAFLSFCPIYAALGISTRRKALR